MGYFSIPRLRDMISMLHKDFALRKKAVKHHGLSHERQTKKPWGPEEVPTAFTIIESFAQQRTNPSLVSFHHHQLFAVIFIVISLVSK
jgi:hypothetical protein